MSLPVTYTMQQIAATNAVALSPAWRRLLSSISQAICDSSHRAVRGLARTTASRTFAEKALQSERDAPSLQQLREVAKGKAHQQAGSHEPATADQAAAGPVSILARLEDWFMCAAKACADSVCGLTRALISGDEGRLDSSMLARLEDWFMQDSVQGFMQVAHRILSPLDEVQKSHLVTTSVWSSAPGLRTRAQRRL